MNFYRKDDKGRVAANGSKPRDMSISKCAGYVKKAIWAGGLPYYTCNKATDCGDPIMKGGWKQIYISKAGDNYMDNSRFEPGDVCIITSFQGKRKNHDAGHMVLWTGKEWISDFLQGSCYTYGSDGELAQRHWNNGGYHFYRYRNRTTT